MKHFNLVLGSLIALFFMSCIGPEGPQGFDGFDGLDGLDGQDGEPGIQAQIFEVEGLDLSYIDADNVWETVLTFEDFTNFEVLKEDAILVYRFDGSVSFEDGTVEDAWGLIPQNFFLDEGIIQYVSSHTLKDVAVLIDGNFNLSNIDIAFTDNQLLRVVIVPGVAASGKMDTSSMTSIMASLGITDADIQKYKLD
jgi:hypothetical protein